MPIGMTMSGTGMPSPNRLSAVLMKKFRYLNTPSRLRLAITHKMSSGFLYVLRMDRPNR